MPFEWLQENIFYTPEKKKEINRQQREAAARNPAAQQQQPETQAQRTERINAKARELATPKGFELTGAAGMMSGRTQPRPEKPPATAQPPQGEMSQPENRYRDRERTGITRMGGVTYDLSIPHHRELYQAAVKKNQESMGNPKTHDLRGGSGLKPDGSGQFDAPPKPSPYVDQQGRDSGKLSGAGFAEANGLLERLGITTTRYGDFQSNDLPGTPNTQSDYEAMGGSSSDAARYYSGEGVETEIGPGPTPIEGQQTQGSPNLTKSGGIDTTQEVKTAPLGSVARYGQEFMADRPGMRAQDSTSLVGLRAAEASKGLLYASGKYWKANPNAGGEGEKDFVEIQKDEWNTIKRGEVHAQDFLSEKIEETKPKVSLDSEQESYQVPENQKPTSRIDSTAQVDTQQITEAPTLTQAVDVRFTDKDRTGRYNNFNNR